MEEIEVTTFADFHDAVQSQRMGTIYRGVPDAEGHKLIPSLGRHLLRLRASGASELQLRESTCHPDP